MLRLREMGSRINQGDSTGAFFYVSLQLGVVVCF